MLPGLYLPVGRGRAREYTRADLFYLMVIRELSKIGLSLSNIRPAVHHLELAKPLLWIDDKTIRQPAYLVMLIDEDSGEASRWEVLMGEADIKKVARQSVQVILNLNMVFDKVKV